MRQNSCFFLLLFAILHWRETTAQHHNRQHNTNDGLHNNNNNNDDIRISQAAPDQSATTASVLSADTTDNKSTSQYQSSKTSRRRRLTPTDDIATFIQQEHNAGISRVSFTLVGERQQQQQDVDVSETTALHEDMGSKQPIISNNNNPFIQSQSSATTTPTTYVQYEIELIEANPSLLPTTRITTLNGEQYTYDELVNKNIVHLVAAHPEVGDFALIVVYTDDNTDNDNDSGGGVGGIRSRVEGMARHKNEDLVKIQQVEEGGGRTKVVVSKQKDVLLPDWKCGVTDDFVHSHSHASSDHNHNHAHHMHDEDTGVHIHNNNEDYESLGFQDNKYYSNRPNAFDNIGSRDKKRGENKFNVNELPSFSVDKSRGGGGRIKKKGLKNNVRGERRNHRGSHRHGHHEDTNIFSDGLDFDSTDSTIIHNLYADAGDWRHRRATATSTKHTDHRELYPTDSFPKIYTYEAKLYIEIDQAVIDSNGGNLTMAIEYINALVTASSAIFEEEVDTHCKLLLVLVCIMFPPFNHLLTCSSFYVRLCIYI